MHLGLTARIYLFYCCRWVVCQSVYTASITWKLGDQDVTLSMVTNWPYKTGVGLTVTSMDQPTEANIRVRVPSWATGSMQLTINDNENISGEPETFVNLTLTWMAGDKVAFTLPADYHMIQYTGVDQIPGHNRYPLQWPDPDGGHRAGSSLVQLDGFE